MIVSKRPPDLPVRHVLQSNRFPGYFSNTRAALRPTSLNAVARISGKWIAVHVLLSFAPLLAFFTCLWKFPAIFLCSLCHDLPAWLQVMALLFAILPYSVLTVLVVGKSRTCGPGLFSSNTDFIQGSDTLNHWQPSSPIIQFCYL